MVWLPVWPEAAAPPPLGELPPLISAAPPQTYAAPPLPDADAPPLASVPPPARRQTTWLRPIRTTIITIRNNKNLSLKTDGVS
jgi:hypothetical protein